MVFIARTVPAGSSNTAQALFAALTNGLGLGAGLLIAGLLYAAWGPRAPYWACAGGLRPWLRRSARDENRCTIGSGSDQWPPAVAAPSFRTKRRSQ